MRFVLALLLSSVAYAQYGAVLVGDVGAKTIIVTDSGSVGGTQTVTLPIGASQKFKIWFSIAGFPERGSESACPAPCGVSINTEYGRVSYWYEITDSSGNPLSPPKLSAQEYLAFTDIPTLTAPFTVPATIHGFKDYKKNYQFNPGAVSVSNLRVWLRLFNPRDNDVAIVMNGTEHKLGTTDVTALSSNGSGTCTITTLFPHGFTGTPVVQLWGFPGTDIGYNGLSGSSVTVISIPTTTSFTFSCTLGSGDWYRSLDAPAGADLGAQVSSTTFYADQKAWFNGLKGVNGQSFEVMVPLGAGEVTASANNTLGLKFLGVGDVSLNGLAHGYYTDFEVVQPDIEITQIVVSSSGTLATVTTSGAHGYANSDTILIRDAPGPRCLNGRRSITVTGSTTFTFAVGADINPGQIVCTMANATYTAPTSANVLANPQPHMYAARCLIPKSSYAAYDPSSFPSFGGNASTGSTLWHTATLKEPNGYFPAHASQAHCNSCHTTDGNDLKYFAYHPYVIKVAAIHRGLTETQANDIVAYIASLSTAYSGKPWDPPYQSAPGMDSVTQANWSAGGGLDWCLTYDADTKTYLVPSGSYAQWVPNGTVNVRNIPTFRCLPPWSVWLPETAPEDYWHYVLNADWTTTTSYTRYAAIVASLPNNFSTYQAATYFNNFLNSFNDLPFSTGHPDAVASKWPTQSAYQQYGTEKWLNLRIWEFMNQGALQDLYDQSTNDQWGTPNARAGAQHVRGILFTFSFQLGPHKRIMANTQQTFYNKYSVAPTNHFLASCQWYKVALVQGDGNRDLIASGDIDGNYNFALEQNCMEARPSFWEKALLFAVQPQATWGLPSLNNAGGVNMQLQSMSPTFLLTWNFGAGYTSSTDIAAMVEAEAQQLLTMTAAFTTGQWQTFWANGNCISKTPDARSGYNTPTCLPDSYAYGLAVMNTLGVDATTLAGLAAFATALSTSGHNFTSDAAATCVITGTMRGDYSSCTNFP